MAEYKGTVELIGGLTPKNNGTFPLMTAKDIQVARDGTRLDAKLKELSSGGASIATEIAPSVDWLNANGDPSKCYLLPDGYIYEYTEGTETTTHNAVPEAVEAELFNKMPKANGSVNQSGDQTGNFCTLPIEVDPTWTSCVVTISGLDKMVKIAYQAMYAYIYANDTDTFIDYPSCNVLDSTVASGAAEVALPFTFDLAKRSKWSQAKYIRISVGISKETITADDVASLVINVAQLNTEGTGGGWQSTGKTIADFLPAADKVNWVALGDSITARWTSYIGTDGVVHVKYDSTVKGWVDYVAEINGYTLTNKGVAGIGFAYGGPNNKTVPDVVDATDFSGADLVTIMAGINDFNSNAVELGAVTDAIDRENLTVVSGLRYCIERILAAKPDCKIVVITPINCKTCGNYASNYAIDYEGTDRVGGNLRAFAAALVEVCEYYGIEWVDMTHASVVNRQNIGSLLLDSLHPTAECHEAMGRELANKINFIMAKNGSVGINGENGKSAYEYAQEGGYTGTEEEFRAKLAVEANTTGQLVVEPSAWTGDGNDLNPYTELITLSGNVIGAGDLILIVPEDDETKEVAVAAGLTVQVNGTIDNNTVDYVVLARAENGTAPTVALNLRYVVIHTANTKLRPVVTLVGVSSGGMGSFITAEGSGMDETTYIPNFTNLFDPKSAQVGYRTNSSGEVVKDTVTTDAFVGDFIELVKGRVIYIKNVKAQGEAYLRFQGYDASKVKVGTGFYLEKPASTAIAAPCGDDVTTYEDELGETVLRWEAFKIKGGTDYGFSSDIKYVRLTGVPTATMDDIVVTVDKEISYTPHTGEGTIYTLDERVVVPGVVKNAEKIASMQSGAVCYVLGDSIPQGYYSTDEPSVVNGVERDYTSYYPNPSVKAWPRHMADVCGFTLNNHAIGGTGYVHGEYNFRVVADNIDFSECDIAIIHGGINDFKYAGHTLGSMDNDIARGGTVVSNLRYIIKKILADNPYCKIVVVSPINYRGYGTYETNFSIGYLNENGYASFAKLSTMCDALKEACEYHGVQFIDATHCSMVNRENIKTILPDYAHPTPEGHRVLGYELARRINFA